MGTKQLYDIINKLEAINSQEEFQKESAPAVYGDNFDYNQNETDAVAGFTSKKQTKEFSHKRKTPWSRITLLATGILLLGIIVLFVIDYYQERSPLLQKSRPVVTHTEENLPQRTAPTTSNQPVLETDNINRTGTDKTDTEIKPEEKTGIQKNDIPSNATPQINRSPSSVPELSDSPEIFPPVTRPSEPAQNQSPQNGLHTRNTPVKIKLPETYIPSLSGKITERSDTAAGNTERNKVSTKKQNLIRQNQSRPSLDTYFELKQWLSQAEQSRKNGDWEGAIRLYRMVWEQERQPAVANNLAAALISTGQINEAKKILEQAIQLAPEDTELKANYRIIKEMRH